MPFLGTACFIAQIWRARSEQNMACLQTPFYLTRLTKDRQGTPLSADMISCNAGIMEICFQDDTGWLRNGKDEFGQLKVGTVQVCGSSKEQEIQMKNQGKIKPN